MSEWFQITKEEYECLRPVYRNRKHLLLRITRHGDLYYFVGSYEQYLFARERLECLKY